MAKKRAAHRIECGSHGFSKSVSTSLPDNSHSFFIRNEFNWHNEDIIHRHCGYVFYRIESISFCVHGCKTNSRMINENGWMNEGMNERTNANVFMCVYVYWIYITWKYFSMVWMWLGIVCSKQMKTTKLFYLADAVKRRKRKKK